MTVVTRFAAAIEQRDWAQVDELLVSRLSELMNDHRDVYVSVLRALPQEFFDTYPRHRAALSYAEFIPASGTMRPIRFSAPSTAPSTLVDVLYAATARSAAARMAGDHRGAVRAADEAREIFEEATGDVIIEAAPVMPDVSTQWGITYFMAGELDRALDTFEATYDRAIAAKNTRIVVEASGNCALILALQGIVPGARRWLARVPALDDPTDTVADASAIAAALVAIDVLDADAARGAIERFAADDLELEHWALRMFARVRRALIWEVDLQPTMNAVSAAIAERSPTSRDTGLNAVLIALSLSELRLRLGDLGEAGAAAELVHGGAPHALRNALRITDARVAAASGRPERARATLAMVLSNQPMPRDFAAALVLRAALATDPESTRTDLEAAARWIRDWSLDSMVTLAPREAWSDLEVVAPDGPVYSPSLPTGRPGRLTVRERSVLRRVTLGETVAAIAEADNLSPHTVKKQLGSAYRKIGAHSREEAASVVAAAPWLLAE